MRKARRRVLVTLTTVLLVLIAAEAAVRLTAERLPVPLAWNAYEVQNKADRMRAIGRADIAILGSSSMNAAVDPRRLGRRSFNAALNGADMRSVAFWAEHVVLPLLRPKIVVVGTTSLELNDNGITQRDFFRRLRTSDAARALTGSGRWTEDVETWLERRSFLVRYRSQLRRPARLFEGDSAEAAGQIDAVGRLDALGEFQSRPYGVSPEFARRTHDESYFRYAVGGEQLVALQRLAHILDREGRRLVLVTLPVTDDLSRLHDDAGERAYQRALAGFVSAHDPTVVDAASELRDPALFVDPVHVNRNGARLVTDLVAQAVAAAG